MEIKLGSFLSLEDEDSEEEDEDGDRTALPPARQEPGIAHFSWGRHVMSASIDEMLLQKYQHQHQHQHQQQDDAEAEAETAGGEDPHDSRLLRQSQASLLRVGPMTPNGYDDISPTTRGEWGFLFSGDAWKQGKTAAVETC